MQNINIGKLNLDSFKDNASDMDTKGAAASCNDSFYDADTASCSDRSESSRRQRQIDIDRLQELFMSDEQLLTEQDYAEWREIRERRKAETAAW